MADNLLDKASILLTPTAYNDGSMLSIKPENGDGDFTFSRSSAATRVNAQGLVENVQIISSELVSNGNFSQIGTEEVLNGNFSQEGSELIVNGDFSNGGADWNSQLGWTFSNGLANFENLGSSNKNLWQSPLVAGKSYKLTFEIISISSGYIRNVNSSITDDVQFSTVGVHTQYFIADNVNLYLKASDDAVLSIDNISVKEVGQNWYLSIGDTAIGENIAIFPTSTNSFLIQNNVASLSVKTYKLQYEVVSTNGSNFRLAGGGSAFGTVNLDSSTTGVKTFYLQSNGTQHSLQFNNNAFIGSITNISVKEVGQDWTLGTGWSVDQANSKATCDGTQTSTSTLQSARISNIQNDLIKLSFEIKDYSAGTVSVTLQGTGGIEFINLAANGVYEINVTSTDSLPRLLFNANSSFIGSITNISVKEITDDTDLPRINYSGFSYQDSLGSEQVVNGDFSTDISNWVSYGSGAVVNWNSNGYLEVNNSGNGYWCKVQQNNVFEIGKTYFIEIKAKSNISNKLFHGLFNDKSFSQVDTFETITGYYTATGTHFQFGYHNVSAQDTTITIDNISVKEYLGQEVVPDSGCGSWLLEPQSTNLVTYSSDFSTWLFGSDGLPNNMTRVDGQSSPDGGANSSLYTRNSGTSGFFSYGNTTVVLNQTYTYSLFVKKGTSSTIEFRNVNNSPQSAVVYNIDTDTFTTEQSATGSSVDYGNGWYRIAMTFEHLNTSTTSAQIRHTLEDGESMYVFGSQFENLSYATSYIPTNGATNTRLQDIANNSGNASLINSTEGVLYAEIAALADDSTNRSIAISDNSSVNRIVLKYDNQSNIIQCFNRINSVETAFLGTTVSDITQFNKIAVKFKLNDYALWVNGTEVDTDNTSTVFPSSTLNDLSFDNGGGGDDFFGKAKAIAVYKEALTDAELQSLTTI